MRRKESRYRFTDEGIASDTVIALVFGFAALALILVLVILAVRQGKSGEKTPMLLAASVVMVLNALVFSILSLRAQYGGMRSKRLAMWISLIDTALVVALFIL